MTTKLESAQRDQQWYEWNKEGVPQEVIAARNGVRQSYVSKRINIHREKMEKIGTSRTVEKTLLRKELLQGEVEHACRSLEWADFDKCRNFKELLSMVSAAVSQCPDFVRDETGTRAKLLDFLERAYHKAALLEDPFYEKDAS